MVSFVPSECHVDIRYEDDINVLTTERACFVSMRSCYLTFHRRNVFTVEPYSPHRFGRQFGFYHIVPGSLKRDVRQTDLVMGFLYWHQSVMTKTMSVAQLLRYHKDAGKPMSPEYKS